MQDKGTPTATNALATYLRSVGSESLPSQVFEKACCHFLDTIAAMVSGITLHPGTKAMELASSLSSVGPATIVSRPQRANPIDAALINGMFAHADETDDSHAAAGMHPGCAIVPAALSMAENNGRTGPHLIEAIVAGYDVGARLMRAVGPPHSPGGSQLSAGFRFDRHAVGGTFGAAVAAGMCAPEDLDEEQWEHLLSYAAHQASGMPSYPLDSLHVEKAFIFGGMPARNGTTAAAMVALGFTGISNDLEGPGGFMHCFGTDTLDPDQLNADLGKRYEIIETNIKKFSVGSPCQAAVDCLSNIIDQHGVTLESCDRIVLHAATGETPVTRRNQVMPDLNVRYLLAVTLIDGRLGFRASHDALRMEEPDVQELMDRIDIREDASLVSPESPRQARLDFHHSGGDVFSEHVLKVRGVKENPMTPGEVADKAMDLLTLRLKESVALRLVDLCLDISSVDDIDQLTSVLRGA